MFTLAPTQAADLLSWRGDPGALGVNTQETALSPATVSPRTFGKLFSVPLDGQTFAQPLLLSRVRIRVGPTQGRHDVVLAATEHDSVYALDAASGAVLWHTSFLKTEAGVTSVPAPEIEADQNIFPEMGITGTPVVDPASHTLYVSAVTKEVRDGRRHYVQRLHALDVETGRDRAAPALLGDTERDGDRTVYVAGPSLPGTGDGSENGRLTFNAMRQNQRPGLALVGGVVYVAFASHNDIGPYHGWILGLRASDLRLVAVFNDTPNGGLGGIWMGAAKPAADAQGSLYVSTGNGTFDTDLDADGFPVKGDYGNAFLKLAPDPASSPEHPNRNGWGLKVVDYFVPNDFAALNASDADVGGGGVVVLPDAAGSAAHRHLLVGGGKDRRIFLLDRDHLGGFHANGDQDLQAVRDAVNRIFATPSYFDGSLFLAADGDRGKAFRLFNGALTGQPFAQTVNSFGFPGATGAISCHDGRDAILWTLDRGANALRAFTGPGLTTTLYDTTQSGTDAPGALLRFTVPSVVNGRVYVGTNGSLVAYGLRPAGAAPAAGKAAPTLTAPPTPTDARAVFRDGHVELTWRDHAGDAARYRILRKVGEGGVFLPIADLPAHSTNYADNNGIRAGADYHYHVLALNAAGNSDFAGVAITTPVR